MTFEEIIKLVIIGGGYVVAFGGCYLLGWANGRKSIKDEEKETNKKTKDSNLAESQ